MITQAYHLSHTEHNVCVCVFRSENAIKLNDGICIFVVKNRIINQFCCRS